MFCWWRLTARGPEAKVGRRPGVRLKWTRLRRSDKIYTLSLQSITIVISIRGHGGIRTHNENVCYKVINYAVRIVSRLYNEMNKQLYIVLHTQAWRSIPQSLLKRLVMNKRRPICVISCVTRICIWKRKRKPYKDFERTCNQRWYLKIKSIVFRLTFG